MVVSSETFQIFKYVWSVTCKFPQLGKGDGRLYIYCNLDSLLLQNFNNSIRFFNRYLRSSETLWNRFRLATRTEWVLGFIPLSRVELSGLEPSYQSVTRTEWMLNPRSLGSSEIHLISSHVCFLVFSCPSYLYTQHILNKRIKLLIII